MPAEASTRIVTSYLDTRDEQFIDEQATLEDYTVPEPLRGREEVTGWLDTLYHVAFPGARGEIRHITADDHSVAIEFTFTGVNSGSYLGRPPTGRRVVLPMCAVFDVDGSRIRRVRFYYDAAGLARQLE